MFIDTVSGRQLCLVCNKFRGKSTGSSDGISKCLRFIAGHFPNIIWRLSIPPWTLSLRYIFFNWKPQKNLYINERHLLPFRNLLRQLIAIQTLEKRNKVYSQLYWMKTSKVYFKGTVLLTLAKRNFMSSSGNHRTGSGQLDKNGLLSNFRTRSASLSALTLSHRKKPNAK